MQARPLSNPAARNLNPSGSSISIAEGPGLAHDAGNLLGALRLYCDLLDLPGVLRPEHLHYARELRLLSQRSGALINRLLERERGKIESIAGPPPMRSCAATVVRAFAPLLRSLAAPEASVSVSVAPGLPQLPFAAEVLERILVNLTRNAAAALRARPPADGRGTAVDGRIHIIVSGNSRQLHLSVIDNGPGMPAEAEAAFLNPAPLPRGALCGLGHHVIHDLLQSTGGQLSIIAIPNQGTTLQIDWTIPTSKPARTKSRTVSGQIREANARQTLEQLSNFSADGSQHKGAKFSC